MQGIDGNRDVMVLKDALSVLRAAYTMPDKTADSTAHAMKHFKGERIIELYYSDRSVEIERSPRQLHIVSVASPLGVPQNNAVVELLVPDVRQRTRTALVRAGLLHGSVSTHVTTTA